jgi:hypothetical protein
VRVHVYTDFAAVGGKHASPYCWSPGPAVSGKPFQPSVLGERKLDITPKTADVHYNMSLLSWALRMMMSDASEICGAVNKAATGYCMHASQRR